MYVCTSVCTYVLFVHAHADELSSPVMCQLPEGIDRGPRPQSIHRAHSQSFRPAGEAAGVVMHTACPRVGPDCGVAGWLADGLAGWLACLLAANQ